MLESLDFLFFFTKMFTFSVFLHNYSIIYYSKKILILLQCIKRDKMMTKCIRQTSLNTDTALICL